MSSTPYDATAQLIAEQAITRVLFSYARGLDRMDRELADRVWHPDGIADYGPGFRGTGQEFLDMVWAYHAGFECHSHLISNILVDVDLESGTASSEAYVAVWLRTLPTDGVVTDVEHRGRYVDRWSLRDGVWAIDHRTFVGDIVRESQNPASQPTLGSRDLDDPSHAVLSRRTHPQKETAR